MAFEGVGVHVSGSKDQLAQGDPQVRRQHSQRVDSDAVAHAVRQDVDLVGGLDVVEELQEGRVLLPLDLLILGVQQRLAP